MSDRFNTLVLDEDGAKEVFVEIDEEDQMLTIDNMVLTRSEAIKLRDFINSWVEPND